MRTWVLAVMTVLVAFAGCLGGGDDEETGPTETGTSTATGTSTETQTTSTSTDTDTSGPAENETAENTPPSATVTASIEQGQIPFNVTFDLEGSDADGDSLSWSLDADGDGAADADGESLPANHTHTYESEGLWNVTFTVTDGMNDTIQSLVINATAAAAGDAGFETIVITGSISGAYVTTVVLGGAYATDPNSHDFEVAAQASKMTALLEWGEQAIDLDIYLYSPDGTEAGYAANFNDPVLGDGNSFEQVEITGGALSKLGTWTTEVYSAGSVEASYTVTISFTP